MKLTEGEIVQQLAALNNDWENIEDESMRFEFEFETFQEAIDFVNSVAEIAEDQDHHPELHIYFNKVVVDLTSHDEGGLTNRDFELATKIEELV